VLVTLQIKPKISNSMALKKTVTWVNYFDQFNKKKINPADLKVEGIEKLVNVQYSTHNILNHSVPMIYLLDYTTGKYIFVSSQCQSLFNFSHSKMMEGGVDFIIDNYHPADLKLFNERVFTDRLKILAEIPPEQHKDYIFSLNYRIKGGDGNYVNILQRNSFIKSDENGRPLLSLGVVTNVNHFKTENPVIQLVEKVDPITGNVDLNRKNTYYLQEENKVFSKREKEMLLYLADGLTSKQIADKLFISEHTVINHKRNMHHKSNTQNTAALISFAFRQHLL
jgi:DNA-binding CsgD family transcriptional regulator